MPSLVKYSMGKLSRLSKYHERFPPRLFRRIYGILLANYKSFDQALAYYKTRLN